MLKLYKAVEMDMKRRCEDLEYKKKMRLLKKTQKESFTTTGKPPKSSSSKVKMRFSFDRVPNA